MKVQEIAKISPQKLAVKPSPPIHSSIVKSSMTQAQTIKTKVLHVLVDLI